MSEQESDPLYDALRRKLTDYGSPPPETVWAGIQQQLPKQPTTRSTGRKGLFALLGLLLLVGIGGVVYRYAFSPPQPAVVAASRLATSGAAPAAAADAAPTASSVHTQAVTSAADAALRPAAAPAQATTPVRAASAGNSRRGPATAASATTAADAAAHVTQPARRKILLLTRPTRRHSQMRYATQHTRSLHQLRSAQGLAGVPAPEDGSTLLLGAEQQRSKLLTDNRLLSIPRLFPFLLATNATLSVPGLGALPAPLPTPAAPAQRPLPPTEKRPRWSVQVLGGPALTYRTLSKQAYRGFPDSLERPAVGYALHLLVGYAPTPRLQLTAGVGFAEYATALNLRLQHDTIQQRYRHRDTYRFVQVPVQAQYWLREQGRLQVGLLAELAPSFYVGGRVTSGGACACETQTHTAPDSLYRHLSLSATVGATVSYRLGGRWRVFLQPAASYFLSPITQQPARVDERRPVAVGVRGGLSLDLP